MSDATHLTSCPHCSTTFKVTDDQLSIANGVVRCGACLQVFDARSHFVDEEVYASKGLKQPPPSVKEPSQAHVDKASSKTTKAAPTRTSNTTQRRDTIASSHSSAHPTTDSFTDPLAYSNTKSPIQDAIDDEDNILDIVDLSAIQDGDSEDDKPTFKTHSDTSTQSPYSTESRYSLAATSQPQQQSDDTDEAWAEELLKELESDDTDILESLDTDIDTSLDDIELDTQEDQELDFSFFERELNNLKSQSAIASDLSSPELPSTDSLSTDIESTESLTNDASNEIEEISELLTSAPDSEEQDLEPAKTTSKQENREPKKEINERKESEKSNESFENSVAENILRKNGRPSSADVIENLTASEKQSTLATPEPIKPAPPKPEPLKPEPPRPESVKPKPIKSAPNTAAATESTAQNNTTAEKAAHDERWAKSVLEELEDGANRDRRALSDSDKLYLQKKEQQNKQTLEGKEKSPIREQTAASPAPATQPAANKIQANMTLDEEFTAADSTGIAHTEDTESSALIDESLSPEDEHGQEEPTENQSRSLTDIIREKRSQRGQVNHDHHHDDDLSDPFELVTRHSSLELKQVISFIGWTVGSVIAFTGLIAQYLLINFDTLALKSDYRPFYEQACETFDCTLPTRMAIGKMVNRNLVIREHPESDDALLIDTIMINKANFAQPFPDMAILFSNINGRAIAYRRFKPDEYKGDLTVDQVPPHTPVHISLEVVHPGESATNWAIHFKASQL